MLIVFSGLPGTGKTTLAQPWLTKRLVVDTAILSPTEALSLIESHLDSNGS